MRDRDDLVAGSDPERPEREVEGVGAVRAARRLQAFAAEARELVLEGADLGAAYEGRARDDAVEGGVGLVLDRAVLRREVDERDFHATGLAREGSPGM